MWLVIFEKDGKRWFNFQEKLSDPFRVFNDAFETYKLTSKQRIAKFRIDRWTDFYKYLPVLRKYKLQMFVSKNVYHTHTEIGFHIMLLNNSVRNIMLCKQPEKDENLKDDERQTTIYMTDNLKMFEEAEKEFSFSSDIKNVIWGKQ